jgi:hypothetical protein
MISKSCRFVKVTVRAATALAGALAVSCAPQYSAPQQVAASNPSVTFKYFGDQELLQANQQAAAFCSQYQSSPRTAGFANDPSGKKVVIFECVQTTMQAPPPQQYNPNLSYSYRTDAELLEASRSAQGYCTNSGSQPVVSNISPGADGTRIVVFQCGRP